jgi:hypothetical protein
MIVVFGVGYESKFILKSPHEKILRGWCSGPERTGILNIHKLACAYPCCNARQSLCFEDPVE